MATTPIPQAPSVPEWAQIVLHSFEWRVQPFMEVEVSDALQAARQNQGNLGDLEWRGFLAEHSAFLFMEGRGEKSVWGTYFAPFGSGTKADGSESHFPDISLLDAGTLAYWETRAEKCENPVMRARYSDLAWDLKRVITGEKPSPGYARKAIDAYVRATNEKLYPMEIFGVQWLSRALELSLCINDVARRDEVTELMFTLYERIAQPNSPGTWIFLFDRLYGQKFISPEQESRIIGNLETTLAKTSDTTATSTGVHHNLDPWAAEAAADRLARHYRRLNNNVDRQRVIKTYGAAFEYMARQANPMMAMAWLQPVTERYEQEGLKTEAEELQLISADKGKNIGTDLKHYEAKIEIKTEEIEGFIEQLIGGTDLNAALLRIARYFIPRVDEARKFLEQMRIDTPLASIIPINIITHDGHTAAKINSLDDDPDGRLHKQLAETIGFYQPFLARTFERLRESYAPTTEGMLDFLCQSPLFEGSRNSLLQDGILAYEQGDFVKAIHVIVPQVEDILRKFLGHIGRPILKTVRNHPGIMDAKNMNDILADGQMRNVLTENLWRYLEVVYVDKRGLNLRNDLSHGLLRRDAFNRQVADRVFHTLLALSLLRVQQPETSESRSQKS